jgi:hypothetical protein
MNWLIVLMALVMMMALGYVIVSLLKENRHLKAENRRLKPLSESEEVEGGDDADIYKGDEKPEPEPEKEGGQK